MTIPMVGHSLPRGTALSSLVLMVLLLATLGMPGSASGATSCSEIPTVYGIPPWGFHTGPYTGASSFAKGHGNINLEANTEARRRLRNQRRSAAS